MVSPPVLYFGAVDRGETKVTVVGVLLGSTPVGAVVMFLVSIAASVVLGLVPGEDWQLSGRIVVGTAVGLLVLVGTTIFVGVRAIYTLTKEVNRSAVPLVKDLKWVGRTPTFIVEPSRLLSFESLVTIYNREDGGFEERVGIGNVVNVQDNGLVQVELLEAFNTETARQITESKIRPHGTLIAKPGGTIHSYPSRGNDV